MSYDVLRFVQLGAGLAVALHYMWMANYITHAPHYVKALLLPMSTGAGVGMIVSAITGDDQWSTVFSVAACGSMAAMQVAAWHAGAYVSKEFERAYHAKQGANIAVYDAMSPGRYVSDFLDDISKKVKKEEQNALD